MGTGHGRGRLDFPVIPRKQESSAPADACRVRCRAAGRDLDPYFRRGDGGLGSRRNPVRLRADTACGVVQPDGIWTPAFAGVTGDWGHAGIQYACGREPGC